MNGVFIDSCILLDLFTDDPNWGNWSENILDQYSQTNTLYINSIVYTEVSIGFCKIEELEKALGDSSLLRYSLMLFLINSDLVKPRFLAVLLIDCSSF